MNVSISELQMYTLIYSILLADTTDVCLCIICSSLSVTA